jgi:hypothetical protein
MFGSPANRNAPDGVTTLGMGNGHDMGVEDSQR